MSNVKNYTEQGGEKTVIGGELYITTGGKISFGGAELKPAAVQADSVASTIAALVIDFNALLSKLKAAGLMETE
ncbi:MAG: Head fiber protein [Eubacteriaceae bacterium]|nr:Head fiber protein [Eubacteriaceae bacterium]